MLNRASKTAVDVLAARAINTIAPGHKRLIEDPFAINFLPPTWFPLKMYLKLGVFKPFNFYISDFFSEFVGIGGANIVALRHRYIDDRLKEAYSSGIRQVVILGAGYDSRAWRLGLDDVKFVEVDHPQTQKNKIRQIIKMGGDQQKNLEMVSVDFCGDWISDLATSGKINYEPTFFIWEGVSYYLPEEAVFMTLSGIKKHFAAPGSILIFDHYPVDLRNPHSRERIIKKIRRYGSNRGEPFLWGCDKEVISGILTRYGYENIRVTTMGDFARTLDGRDGIRMKNKKVYDFMIMTEGCM